MSESNVNYSQDFENSSLPVTTKKSGGKTAAIIALGALLAGSVGANVYQHTKGPLFGNGPGNVANAPENAKVADLNQKLQSEKDSLLKLLEEVTGEKNTALDNLEAEKAKGGKVAAAAPNYGPPIPMNDPEREEFRAKLQAKINEINELQRKLNTSPTTKVVTSGKPVSAGDRKKFEDQIAELEAKLKAVSEERDSYSQQIAEASAKYDALAIENGQLKEKMKKGAVPQFGTLAVIGVANKGAEQVEVDKAKAVEKLKITFDVLENPLIKDPVEEEVIIRIIDPQGNILSPSTTLQDKSQVYTLRQTVTCDGEMHKVKWFYTSKVKLQKGTYTCELRTATSESVKQKQKFTLK